MEKGEDLERRLREKALLSMRMKASQPDAQSDASGSDSSSAESGDSDKE